MVGLLTPSGIASDLSASGFFRRVSTGGHLKALYDFENKAGLFPDVHRQFKFSAFITSSERTFSESKIAFFLHSCAELQALNRRIVITANDFARINPNTGTTPVFRSQQDMLLTARIYDRLPVLVDRSGGGEPTNAWPVRYARMFDMTNDSGLFRTRAELEEIEGAWRVDAGRYKSATGQWVPLYEGKMIWHFDHRRADIVVNPKNPYRAAGAVELSVAEHRDPERYPAAQFWVDATASALVQRPAIGFRDVTNPTDRSTMVACVIPNCAAGNTLPLLLLENPDHQQLMPLMLANLNATVMDYVCRQKVHKNHLNWYVVEQLPVVPLDAYIRRFGPKAAGDIVREVVLELTYTAHDMSRSRVSSVFWATMA